MSPQKPDDTRSQDTDFSALWSSDGVTRSLSPTSAGMPADLPFLFAPGQRFGSYLIVRPLGKGGMGQVYEAEETESGRRVALKLLSRGLGDDEERERFLREGQLAASLSHPHCVYVFGTSEIQGFPVIGMELVPQGTLKDLVLPEAPMAGTAAVDAILQVIDGLQAAAAIGILHRDIKPSNCFVHRDGRVLVGDFGLSVATTSRDAQGGGGSILGTPGFASPEQLRGDSLDVRSDIYSVGATLFYLLAARAPFEDRDTTSILARVAAEPPPSLLTLRPELSRGLAAVVSRCLAKAAADRFADYDSLREALEPFGSSQLAPAPILRRTLAGAADAWIAGLPLIPFTLLLRLEPLNGLRRIDGVLSALVSVLAFVGYHALLEGRWGAGIGKALFGLRVVDEHQVPPGYRQSAWRALVYELPSQVLKQLATFLGLYFIADLSVAFLTSVMGLIYLLVLFAPARPRNGYLALHDKLTRTRVVKRRVRAESRDAAGGLDLAAAAIASPERIGPYHVPPGTIRQVQERTRIDAFDDRLQRRVWIELLPNGTPPLDAQRRDLGRPTRLRWLAGRRDGAECWDAYEAADGVPLASAVATAQPWSRVRHWLMDLTRELIAGLEDGTLPPLEPGRVWVGRNTVRLLEWTTEGGEAPPTNGPADLASVQRFLYAVISAALSGGPVTAAGTPLPAAPLPLNARSVLLSLRDARFTSGPALLQAVSDALITPAAFPRSRRAVQIAASAFLPFFITVVSLGAILVLSNSKKTDKVLFTLDAALNELERTEKKLKKGPDPATQQVQDDVQVYLAEHMGDVIRNEQTWATTFPNVGARGGRERARHALDAHPVRTREQVARADQTFAKLIADQGAGLEKLMTVRTLGGVTVGILAGTFFVPLFFAMLAALVIGTGFTFRPFGAALVNRRGEPISRARALWRATLVWSPVLLVGAIMRDGPGINQTAGGRLALEVAILAVFGAAAAWAIARPSRGLQDRLAGTWIVPR